MSRDLDRAARALASGSPAYTRRNLFHAYRRRSGDRCSFEELCSGPLAARLAAGPLPGLLPPSTRWDGERLPREWDAYFPKAIVLVDRPEILDLFVASGVIATAKLAVVCVDGSPASVVDWLRRGIRRGHRAPVGFLHDASTAVYPFLLEPLATLVEASPPEEIAFADLGLPVRGMDGARFPPSDLAPGERVLELEALPPSSLVAYAARRMLSMVPGDPLMAPLVRPTSNAGAQR
jgi:hypothetical protein